MRPSIATILDHCRLFGSVDGASRRRLQDIAVLRAYERDHIILRDGEPCPGLFVVGTGLVSIFKMAPSGKQYVLHLVGPGGTFAEVAAMGEFACPAFAEAAEPVVCALLPTRPLNDALRDDHDLCRQLLVGMAQWVKHLVGQLEDITLRDATGRVAAYLARQAAGRDGRVALPVTKAHLAKHLNLTSETLSRTLRRLREAGLIETDDHQHIIIPAPEALAQAADL